MKSVPIIQNDAIRRHFDEESNKWCFSVVDVVGIIAPTSNPRNYWKVLKNRLKKAQNELVTECNQLKMRSSDGKFYLTDTAPAETMLKIIEMVSSGSTPYFEEYFDSLGLDISNGVKEKESLGAISPESSNNSYPQFRDSASLNEENELHLLIDGYYSNNHIIIECFVAGAIVENILISAISKTLTISGTREKEKKIYEENYEENFLCQELSWGKFSRKIELPYEVQKEKIEVVEYRGLLTIRLPMIDKLHRERIKIKSI